MRLFTFLAVVAVVLAFAGSAEACGRHRGQRLRHLGHPFHGRLVHGCNGCR